MPGRSRKSKARSQAKSRRLAAARAARGAASVGSSSASSSAPATPSPAAAGGAGAAALNAPNAPPLPLTDIQVDLFEEEGPRFLLDDATARRILRDAAKLVRVTPSADKHGEGSYGYTTSAEIRLRGAGREFTTVAALKVNKQDPAAIADEGIPKDVMKEIATFARTGKTRSIGKCMFAKLTDSELRFVMEHYLMNLYDVVSGGPVVAGAQRARLARALLFQAASGLKELHEVGVLHKDLKAENILLAHDGRVTLIDFGLSAYVADGLAMQPQWNYFRETSATIQPPEASIRAQRGDPLGPAYDIWSLGCCFAFFLEGRYSFDFWRSRGWMRTVTEAEFEAKRAGILAGAGMVTAEAEALSLLDRMLAIRPQARPTAAQVVADPFFAGMSVAESAREIQEILGLGAYTAGRTKNILGRAHRQGDPGIANNAEIARYFPIRPSPPAAQRLWIDAAAGGAGAAGARGGVADRLRTRDQFNFFFKMCVIDGTDTPLYAYLHMLELTERYIRKTERVPHAAVFPLRVAGCHLIADKTCPFEMTHDIMTTEYLANTSLSGTVTPAQLLQQEIDLMTLFQGDVYPLRDGFVEKFLRYAKEPFDTAAKMRNGLPARVLIGILCYVYCPPEENATLDQIFEIANYYERRYEAFLRHGIPVAVLTPTLQRISTAIRDLYVAEVATYGDRLLDALLFHTEPYRFGLYAADMRRALGIPTGAPLGAPDARKVEARLKKFLTRLEELPIFMR